jgi:hypothetical protein
MTLYTYVAELVYMLLTSFDPELCLGDVHSGEVGPDRSEHEVVRVSFAALIA